METQKRGKRGEITSFLMTSHGNTKKGEKRGTLHGLRELTHFLSKIAPRACCNEGTAADDAKHPADREHTRQHPSCLWEVTEAGESWSDERYVADGGKPLTPHFVVPHLWFCDLFFQKTVCPSTIPRRRRYSNVQHSMVFSFSVIYTLPEFWKLLLPKFSANFWSDFAPLALRSFVFFHTLPELQKFLHFLNFQHVFMSHSIPWISAFFQEFTAF